MLPFKTSTQGFNKTEINIRSFVHIKIIKILFLVIFGTTTIFALLIAWVLYPHKKRQPLPPQLISNTSIDNTPDSFHGVVGKLPPVIEC